ncbi:hypothetical protein [Marinobacter sp. MBR-105]|jgi:hypothetical protein
MSHYYTKAHLTIECDTERARYAAAALDFIETECPNWLIAPTLTGTKAHESTRDWPEFQQALMVAAAADIFEEERDGFSFEWKVKDTGIALWGDDVEDDLFTTAHLILKALDSDQVITCGVAYTCDEPHDNAYGGNYMMIGKHGWKPMIDGHDQTATEVEVGNNHWYWLITYQPEAAEHPNSFIMIAHDKLTKDEALNKTIAQLSGKSLPEGMVPGDFQAQNISGQAYWQISAQIPQHHLQ